MSLCAYCGLPICRADVLCTHHTSVVSDDWAVGNRIMCDFIHRGIMTPATLSATGSDLALMVEWAR